MVCKNCLNELAENETFCRKCGKTVSEEKKTFKLQIPEEKLGNKAEEEVSFEKTKEEISEVENTAEDTLTEVKEAEETAQEEPEEEKSKETETEKSKEEETNEVSEKEETLSGSGEIKGEEISVEDIKIKKAIAIEKANERKNNDKKLRAEKQKKQANTLMLSIVSVCAALMIALSFVSSFTGVFSKNGDEKASLLSSLPAKKAEFFETEIVKFSYLFEDGYDCDKVTADHMLSYLKPWSEKGLYGLLEGKASSETEADPLGRFDLGKGYCKVKSENINRVFSALSLENTRFANSSDAYYFNGYYYFENGEEADSPLLVADVKRSMKTGEGNYYIECDISEEGKETVKKYFLATLNDDKGDDFWSIRKISDTPLFDELGNKINAENDGQSLDYTMKTEIVTVETSKSKTYARYVVIYPEFSASGVTETAINTVYSQKIQSFRKFSETADELYNTYIKNGGNEKDLPLTVYVTANVMYNEKGYISLCERTSTYTKSQFEKGTAFPQTEFESYTYVIENGEFVKKDEVMGKNYIEIQKLLYKQWQEIDDDEPPVRDRNNICAAIYASPWVLSKDGVVFIYRDLDGVLDEVFVPLELITEREILK